MSPAKRPEYDASPVTTTTTARRSKGRANGNGANLGFEEKLWQAADKLRGHMDPGEYKHVVLGLVFLKYISDTFVEYRQKLLLETANPDSDMFIEEESQRYLAAEDRDEYLAENIFWVPQEARWDRLQASARQPEIGKLVDDAMEAIERENSSLRGVLSKDYARPALDKTQLGELIDLIGTISMGDEQSRSQDILGRVYEYFLGRFASAEGKGGGEFYTPRSVVRLLVEMIEPYRGRIYDPCCGSGGMFVQSEKFVEAHGGRLGDLAVYGQESNPTTWRLAKMNLALRHIDSNLGLRNADTFHSDLHPDLKADFVLANPPFNDSDWGGERLRDDVRWRYGTPPASNANFAWVQHFIHHLAPHGIAGFVLANGSMSSNQSGEGDIRRSIVEADLVDCMIAMPGQLFYTTGIPVCLWFLTRDKSGSHPASRVPHPDLRSRHGQTLFIDARKLGALIDRTHRELSEDDIARVANTYHAWRGEPEAGEYADIPGFCKSATLAEIAAHGHVLTPGRYVGAEAAEEDDEPFEVKMQRLVVTLKSQWSEAHDLEMTISRNLKGLGFEI
jgi:type I restriction enzyme M protein